MVEYSVEPPAEKGYSKEWANTYVRSLTGKLKILEMVSGPLTGTHCAYPRMDGQAEVLLLFAVASYYDLIAPCFYCGCKPFSLFWRVGL